MLLHFYHSIKVEIAAIGHSVLMYDGGQEWIASGTSGRLCGRLCQAGCASIPLSVLGSVCSPLWSNSVPPFLVCALIAPLRSTVELLLHFPGEPRSSEAPLVEGLTTQMGSNRVS